MGRVLVTGGAGFIGSHFVKGLLGAEDIEEVTVLDALTYAGHRENLGEAMLHPKLTFVHGNILDTEVVDQLVAEHTAVVHFAAESHVDRSFLEAGGFLATNVHGTHVLLDAARRFGVDKFVHVSTDEVYGSWETGAATENDALRPTVPYAASKAASDLVALSAWHTYGVPVCVTRSSNNFGVRQHPEKIIPMFVTTLLGGGQVQLHGDGLHSRNWLHVQDNCDGIELVLRDGVPGEIYNLGGGTDLTNRALTTLILDVFGADEDRVTYVDDRPSNDRRYSMNCDKAITRLGYRPHRTLVESLPEIVAWYRNNPDRWAPQLRDPAAHRPRVTLTAGAHA
ncbi:MAG: dTDP-glucose 4,6-dehydratase [Pseudonocardiales bacterium]|jgi:dTDP-glucose 4,6-dehydratase|nr:dTDP-glucose 4,6-dehydratase [Pseudonocardiales bacterium]